MKTQISHFHFFVIDKSIPKRKRKLGHFRRDYLLLIFLRWSLWVVKVKGQTLTLWAQSLVTSQKNACHAWKITSKLSVLPFWIFLSSHLALKRNWSCFRYGIFIFLPHFAWRQKVLLKYGLLLNYSLKAFRSVMKVKDFSSLKSYYIELTLGVERTKKQGWKYYTQ